MRLSESQAQRLAVILAKALERANAPAGEAEASQMVSTSRQEGRRHAE